MNALITLILSLLAIGHASARLESSQFHRTLAKSRCGDGACNGSETSSSCSDDCSCADGETCTAGACVSGGFCGDGTCDASEDCSCSDCSCSAGQTCDAGECIYCGDGTCNGSEDCTSCPSDCGTCPNCPVQATSCLCTDGATSCSSDQDCQVSGTCLNGPNGGLPCTSNSDCPKGQSFTDCVGTGAVAEGSCQACSGVPVSSGLISGDINQCDAGYLCGDFTRNTNPVTCKPCLTDMTCNTWCNLDDNLGGYNGATAASTCGSPMSSSWATTWTTTGATCDAHEFCDAEGTISISGAYDNGVCTCYAIIGAESTPVWSSECIENLYVWNIGPDGKGTYLAAGYAIVC